MRFDTQFIEARYMNDDAVNADLPIDAAPAEPASASKKAETPKNKDAFDIQDGQSDDPVVESDQ